jgi:hypothetical protein
LSGGVTCPEDAACCANVGNKNQKKKATKTWDKVFMFTSNKYPKGLVMNKGSK